MRLKARSGQGGRQGYSPSNRTVRKRTQWPRNWDAYVVHELLNQGVTSEQLDDWALIARVLTEHQRVSSGRKRRGTRSARCVSAGGAWE